MARPRKSTPAEGLEPENTRKSTPAEGLVRVSKGGEVLDVHPTTLAEHKQLGWVEE